MHLSAAFRSFARIASTSLAYDWRHTDFQAQRQATDWAGKEGQQNGQQNLPSSNMKSQADHIFSEALTDFNSGKFSLAEQKCKSILQQVPEYSEAYNLLGALAQKAKQTEQALQFFRLAFKHDQNNCRALNNMGKLLEHTDKDEEAEACFKQACSLNPSFKPACTNLVKLYRKHKRYDEAKQLLGTILEQTPHDASANNLLGGILTLQGHNDKALQIFQNAIKVHPDIAELHYNAGNVLLAREDYQGASEAYQRALTLNDLYHPARLALGQAYSRNGNLIEAQKLYQKTIRLKPDFAEAWFSLAALIQRQGDDHLAMKYLDKTIQLNPQHEGAWLLSAKILVNLGLNGEAKQHLARAIEINPGFEEALYTLAKILIQDNELEQALAILENLQQATDTNAHVYFNEYALLKLRQADWTHYDQATARYRQIAQAPADKLVCPPPLSLKYFPIEPAHHCSFAKKYSQHIEAAAPALLRGKKFEWQKKAAAEKIRIGYLSPDFRQHAVGILLNSAFQYHNRDKTEIYLYHLVSHEDDITSTFKQNADVFRNLSSHSYLKAAEAIHQDKIDILIDLAGYTTYSRTVILALRPAPLQLQFMGYPGTMGAPFISGIIADPWLAKETDKEHYSEKIIQVPNAFFTSLIKVSAVVPSRHELGLPEGAFVFCCFNAVYKISPAVFKIWAQILKQVDNGVLWLSETNETAKKNLVTMAAQEGITASRIIFASKRPMEDYMASYASADLFLDTFNYSAGSTAVCAVYAGIPVLTLAGNTNASRMGASISAAAGVEETIVSSEDEYIQKAVYYSRHRPELDLLKLRLKAKQGLLFDLPTSIKHLEEACIREYRQLVECAMEPTPPGQP